MSADGGVRGGIDLGGTKIQTVVVDPDWKVLGQARRQTPTSGGPQRVAEEMAGAMRDALEYAKLHAEGLAGVGVGSPGDVDEETGKVSQARNLPDWNGSFELGGWLAKARPLRTQFAFRQVTRRSPKPRLPLHR